MSAAGGGVAATALLSGAFAALVAVAVTRAIELLGGTLGGLVATLPTTIVPASYGIAALAGLPIVGAAPASARPQLVAVALFAFPAGALTSSGFLAVWRYLPPLLPPRWPLRVALPVMVGASLGTWCVCAVASGALARLAPTPQPFGVACFVAQAAAGLSATAHHRAAPRGTSAVPLRALLLRGGLAGAAICAAVALSAAAGDGGVAAGLASAFPVIFLTVQVSLWLGQDKAVQGGAVGPMMLGGIAVPAFAMMFAVLAPYVGIAPAIAVAWVLSVALCSLPAFAWLRWRAAVSAAAAAEAAAAQAAEAAEASAAGAALPPGADSAAAPPGAVAVGGALLAAGSGAAAAWDEASIDSAVTAAPPAQARAAVSEEAGDAR